MAEQIDTVADGKPIASPETKKESDDSVLADCRKHLKELIDDEEALRTLMEDDLAFCTLDQWPADIRKERETDIENGPRPCLTIDKIGPFIDQVVNDVQQGRPGINVRPQDDESDPETAKILKGLIRNIEDQSSADIAYGTAVKSATRIGLGYIRVLPEYVSEDSFDQDLFIRPIANTFAVHLGRHVMPDGSDATRGYVAESMIEEKFCGLFPKAKFKIDDFNGLGEDLAYWRTGDNIVVVEEYVIESVPQTLYFLSDGTTITQEDYNKWPESAGPKPEKTDERQGFKKQLKWRKMTGIEVLEQRDLPGKYIPIIEVIGKEAWVKGKRMLWGLTRPAKDSLRMYNYFSSSITEKMGLAPKAPWVGAVGQFATAMERWKKSNRNNYAMLEYDMLEVNGNAVPPPQRVGVTPMETALLHQLQVIEHDVQTSLGMYKAATGESESQQSGRAILALQKESDTGTSHFGHNLGVSIRHVGRILIDLIPHYYDTKRVVRILGDDGEVQTAQIDPEQEQAHRQITGTDGAISHIYNPGVGQYDISITVGPSYNTKRMEDQAIFVEMAKGASDPASAAVLHYLIMRNSDTPGSQEAAKLLKAMLPPQAQQALASKQPIPPEAQMAMQQMQQKMQMMSEAGQKLQQENQKLKAGTMEGMAKIQADAEESRAKGELARSEAEAELNLQKQKQDGELQLARDKAAAEIEIKRAVAEADHAIAIGKLDFEKQRDARAQLADASADSDAEATQVAPKLIQAMDGIVAGLADVIANQQEFQKQVLAQTTKPKTITAKSSSGTTLTATVQ